MPVLSFAGGVRVGSRVASARSPSTTSLKATQRKSVATSNKAKASRTMILLAQAVTVSNWPKPIDVVKLDPWGICFWLEAGVRNSQDAGVQRICLPHLVVATNSRDVRGGTEQGCCSRTCGG